MIKTVEGIVLQKESIQEADELLTLYTRELGKVKAKIVGVKKILSKLRPLTFPFSCSSLQIFFRGGARGGIREPGKVIGGEVLQSHTAIRKNWEKIIPATIWCETVHDLTPSFYPNFQEYQLVASTLDQLEQSRFPEIVRLRSTLILLKILGYSFRHHAEWKKLKENERNLFYRLARWKEHLDGFQKEEVEKLKVMIHSYLALYLNKPLKSELFRQKFLQSSSHHSGVYSWI